MKSYGKPLRQLGCALGVWFAFATCASAETIVGINYVHVNSRSNIFSAGQDSPMAPAGGGAGILPVLVPVDPALANPADGSPMQRVLTFPELELTSPLSADGISMNGLDGGTDFGGMTHLNGLGGIAGIMHADRNMFLTGVFLDDNAPTGTAPEALSFSSAMDFEELKPELGQPFFVGDGKSDTGAVQRFIAPDAATRLYLGVADGFEFQGDPGFYDDNQGGIDLHYNIQAVPVPEPATLLGWSVAMGAAAVWGVRRRKTMRLA